MKIAVERRNHRWLAQVVEIANPSIHWIEHMRIQKEMHAWAKENCNVYHVNGWQFWFLDEQDVTAFLLRWQG